MSDLVSHCKPLALTACACINTDYDCSLIAQDEARFCPVEVVTRNYGTFAACDYFYRHRGAENIIFFEQVAGFLFFEAHQRSSRAGLGANCAIALRTKSCVVSGVPARCSWRFGIPSALSRIDDSGNTSANSIPSAIAMTTKRCNATRCRPASRLAID